MSFEKQNPFPPSFLWGSATSSYQVEGGIENCDWAQGAREGKVPPCGKACDHYNRYEEDFDIAKSLGHNAHRFSIEWSRIEPEEGKFNEHEIEHYRTVLKALHERGLYPLVTLWHFTLPLWFTETGGWSRKDATVLFARYCAFVTEKLADYCDNVATMNEPMVFAGLGYVRGVWPPFCTRAFPKYFSVLYTLVQAHKRAYREIKKRTPKFSVGLVKHTVVFGARGNPLNHVKAWVETLLWTRIFMSCVSGSLDFIGVNYYQRKIFGDERELQKTDMGWNSDPEGIYDALLLLSRYKKQLYVAEAGCADAQDRFRAEYIRKTVEAIVRAREEGVDVRGYCYWSLLDNYEWAEGFDKRFGLVEINYDTLERKIRPSAYVYKDLITHHSN